MGLVSPTIRMTGCEGTFFRRATGTSGHPTNLGALLCDYFQYRAKILNTHVQPNLMDAQAARETLGRVLAHLQPGGP